MMKETTACDDNRIMLRQMKLIPVQTAAGVRMINPDLLRLCER